MIRLVTFDLDGTLAEFGEGIQEENLKLLKEIEEKGARIALCSGKPTYYLCGFLRQVGLKAPVLAGENGSVIQLGVDLPPKQFYIQKYSEEAKESIRFIKQKLEKMLPNLWYQPNLVGLTPFPAHPVEFDMIQDMIDSNKYNIKDIDIYRHADCFDFMPRGLSKFSGMEMMGDLLAIPAEDTVCVGDGVNDYPMFEYAGLALGIHVEHPEKVDRNFTCINEALKYILAQMEEQQ